MGDETQAVENDATWCGIPIVVDESIPGRVALLRDTDVDHARGHILRRASCPDCQREDEAVTS